MKQEDNNFLISEGDNLGIIAPLLSRLTLYTGPEHFMLDRDNIVKNPYYGNNEKLRNDVVKALREIAETPCFSELLAPVFAVTISDIFQEQPFTFNVRLDLSDIKGVYNRKEHSISIIAPLQDPILEKRKKYFQTPWIEDGNIAGFVQNIVHEFGHCAVDRVFRHDNNISPELEALLWDAHESDIQNLYKKKTDYSTDDISTLESFTNCAVLILILRNSGLNYSEKHRLPEHIARIGEVLFLASYLDKQNGDKEHTLFNYCTTELIPKSYMIFRDFLLPAYQHYVDISQSINDIQRISGNIATIVAGMVSEKGIEDIIEKDDGSFMARLDRRRERTEQDVREVVQGSIERGLIHHTTPDALHKILTSQKKTIGKFTGVILSHMEKKLEQDDTTINDLLDYEKREISYVNTMPEIIKSFSSRLEEKQQKKNCILM